MSSGDAAAPPRLISRMLERSKPVRLGHWIKALAMVGTIPMPVAFSSWIRRKTRVGSKRRTITCVRPLSVELWARPQPLAWNSGMVCSSTFSSQRTKVATTASAWRYSVRWHSMTPLGVPVEPLV